MKRTMIAVLGLTTVALLGAVAVAGQSFEVPDFLSAEELRPVPTPPEDQQVAVLQVALTADGDKVSAEVQSKQVIHSFVPKSVARSAGEWEVRVLGGKELRYLIPNPLNDVEIENPDDPEQPFQAVPTTSMDWTLIVPLFDQGEALNADRIEVVDVASGAVILETAIR